MKIKHFNDYNDDEKKFKIENRKIIFLENEEDFVKELQDLIFDYSCHLRGGNLTTNQTYDSFVFLENATDFFIRLSLQRK